MVKVYVDLRGVLKKDPTVMLGDEDSQGQIEFKVDQWPNGFPKGQWVSAKDLKK